LLRSFSAEVWTPSETLFPWPPPPPLRVVVVADSLVPRFLHAAEPNSACNLETCGILAGVLVSF
jgi:hypothetical protein